MHISNVQTNKIRFPLMNNCRRTLTLCSHRSSLQPLSLQVLDATLFFSNEQYAEWPIYKDLWQVELQFAQAIEWPVNCSALENRAI